MNWIEDDKPQSETSLDWIEIFRAMASFAQRF
jgi:hypothetical protein